MFSGRPAVLVCCWFVVVSWAWKVRLSPVSTIKGVPESSPVLDKVSPVPVSEPALSDQLIVPVPPVEVS